MTDCDIKIDSCVKPRVRTKSEEKSTKILEAASDLFLSQGFDDVSMVAVANAAGVSKQTIYSHFGCKDELFSAAISARCQSFQVVDVLEDLNRPIKETLMMLAHQFDALINSYEALRIYGICAANNIHPERNNHISTLFWESGPKKVKEAVVAYFIAQQDAGKIQLEQAEFAALQFLFTLQAEDTMRSVIGLECSYTPEQQDAYLHSCVDMFCRAYGIE
ncbi:MAG: TetR/AcrR family transcriptional regulator [Sinobacterium sp.]|nr:TetR/AcrR family transcriptional regulator [Sinobacterium sp.]